MTNVTYRFVSSRTLRLGLTANAKALFCIICLLFAPNLFAQTTASADAEKSDAKQQEDKKKVLELTKFSVTTTQDRGFLMNNSAGAFRTNEVLLNIPQTVIVVTRDMLDAIRFSDTSTVMSYFGMIPSYEGEEMLSRGGGMLAFQDDVPQGGIPFADNGVIDNYEIIKGAAQVLYLSNSLAGVVLKNTKKPLPYTKNVIEMSLDSFGSMRGMIDSTGPLGEVGGVKISYRFVGIRRDDARVFTNLDHKATVIMPEVQFDFKNTRIRAYYERSNLLRSPNNSALLQPDGSLYVPPTGVEHANHIAKNSMEHHDSNVGFVEVSTHLSDNWDNQLKVSYRHSKREGSNTFALYTNWDTRQVGYLTRKLDLPSAAVVIMDDLQGKYHIGPTEHTDAFGFIEAEQTFWSSIWGSNTLPDNSIWKTTPLYLPIDDTQNLIETAPYAAPIISDYDGRKVDNAYSRQTTKSRTIYYAHSANITKYVTLTAGISWAQAEVSGINNLNVRPYTSPTPTLQDENLHRYGVVLKPIEGLSVYALESTTFNAAGGGGQVLSDGTFPKNPIGKNRELGLKTDLFGGRLTSNFSIFEMTISGLLRTRIRDDGTIYFEPIPGNESQRTKGYDMNVGIGLLPGLQVLGSYSNYHDITSVYNHPVWSWSVFADYKFPQNSWLRGLTIGGGSYHVDGKYQTIANYTYSGKTAEELASGLKKVTQNGTPVKIYAGYKYNKHLDLRLSIDNLLDEVYPYGGGSVTTMNVASPRTITLNAIYTF